MSGRIATVTKAKPATRQLRATLARAIAPIHRHDHLERQADRAASHAVRGDLGIANLLTSTRPANPNVTGSPGAPLEAALRARLEQAFGADLGAVRVHRDTNAVADVRARGARGYAAGAHVFLDGGGVGLLAHEIAHVLQQTGREREGRIHATDARGDAPVQCDLIGDLEKEKILTAKAPDLADLTNLYQTAHPKDLGLDAELKTITGFVGFDFKTAPPSGVASLIAETGTTRFAALAPYLRGLYVDCLKALGKHAEAVALQDKAKRAIPTMFASVDFARQFLKKHGTDWVLAQLEASSKLKGYPGNFVDAYRIFLFTVALGFVELRGDASALGNDIDAVNRGVADGSIPGNELDLIAARTMGNLESQRMDLLIELTKLGNENHADDDVTVIDRFLANAKRVAENPITWLPKLGAEVTSLSGSLAPRIKAIAQRAEKLWGFAAAVRDVASGANKATIEGLGDAAAVGALAKAIGGSADGAAIDTAVAGFVTALVTEGKAALGPSALGKRADVAIKELEKIGKSVELKLLARDITKAGAGADRTQVELATTVALAFQMRLVIRELYKPSVDADYRSKNELDYVVARRIVASRWSENFAPIFGFTALAKAAAAYLTDDRADLALLDDNWTVVDGERGEASADLGGSTVLRNLAGTGITVYMLERYSYLVYYDALKAQLKSVLDANQDNTAPRDRSLLDDAIQLTDKHAHVPRRFLMENAYWFVGAKATAQEKSKFATLLLAHPKVARIPSEPGELLMASDDIGKHLQYGTNTVAVWGLPSIDRLVVALRTNIKGLDEKVRAKWKELNGDEPPADWSWLDWLNTLGELARALAADNTKASELAQLKLDIDTTAEKDAAKTRAALRAEVARAIVDERHRVARTELMPVLDKFDRWDLSRFADSDKLRDAILNFVGLVERASKIALDPNAPPPTNEPMEIQATALVLECFGSFVTAFHEDTGVLGTGPFDVGQVNTWLVPLLGGVVDTWNNSALRPQVVAQIGVDEALIDIAAKQLDALRTGILAKIDSHKREFGLSGDATKKELTTRGSEGGGDVFKVPADPNKPEGSEFTYGGKVYRLVDVHKSFVWFSPYRLTELVPFRRKETAGASLLFEADGKTPLAKTGDKLITMTVVDLESFDAGEVVITDRDDKRLDDLGAAVAINAIAEQLKALGETMEAVANFAMEVLEFVPGVGQVVMAVRLLESIVKFLGSEEFAAILKAFQEDGIGAIPKFLKQLVDLFDPVKLITFLLFRAPTPFADNIAPPAAKGKAKEMTEGSDSKWAKVGRALKNIFGFVGHVVRSMNRVTKLVQMPLRGLRLWILEHPFVAMILEIVADVVMPVAQLTFDKIMESRDENPSADLKTVLMAAIAEGINGAVGWAVQTISGLSFLELPETIIPMDVVVDFLLDLVINSLPSKYKLALKGLRFALHELKIWGKITRRIAEGLNHEGLDPNIFYQNEVRSRLQPHLDDIRKTFLETFWSFLSSIPVLSGIVKKPEEQKIDLSFRGEGFPEAEKSPATSDFPDLPSGPLPTPGGGDALAPSLRATNETALGHDLGHVRLHRGSDAERLTHSYAADGVTTGSHVYMRPTLDPSVGAGAHVFRHELSHVVEQAGPRPLGGAYETRPSIGSPGRGLTIDPAAEARAESVASGASRPTSSAPAAGAQASFTFDFIRNVIGELTDPDAIRKLSARIEARERKKQDFHGDEKAPALVNALATHFVTAITDGKIFKANKPFDKVLPQLKDYVNAHGKTLGDAFELLVKEAHTAVKLKAPKDGKEEGFWVNPSGLGTEIGEFLLGDAGLYVAVELNTIKDPDVDRDVVNVEKPFKSLQLDLLNLAYMKSPEKEAFMTLAINNTWKSLSEDKRDRYAVAAELYFLRRPDDLSLWDASEFAFNSDTKGTIERFATRLDTVFALKKWPTPDEYLESDPAKISDKDLKWNGLRFDFYRGREAPSTSLRESHHIIQYLFVEYLSNKLSLTKPFPHLGAVAYPGVTSSGKLAQSIGTFDVGQMDKDRGGDMPTISLAYNTHRSNVHIQASKPDEEAPGASITQSATAHRWFEGAMRSKLSKSPEVLKELPTLTALAKASSDSEPVLTPNGAVSRDDVKQAIFSSTRTLYNSFSSDMHPRLFRALVDREVPYYNLVAPRLKVQQKLTTEQAKASWALAVGWANTHLGKKLPA